ncbi:4876_t:CDS:2 [Paraglomus occultum]|uniref:4876_t:CDS:1 n=1 Tax=Paraglomus occultum TaxID=144539 RepID=A0A9N9A0V4_9GLOM|nr:4876_t:CDS:2 [Paraglomus occultum]
MIPSLTSLFSSPPDLTYGRASLPYNKYELAFRSAPYHHTEYIVPFPNHPTYPNADHFIYYQTWSLSNVKQRNLDVMIVHGMDGYGGRFSQHIDPALREGFRVIALDLPSFGRSSGKHAYLNDWKELTEAVHCVIDHLKKENENYTDTKLSSKGSTLPYDSRPNPRKLVLCGESLGGFITLCYSILYPHTIDAIHLFCPLVFVSETSRPSKLIELVAKVIAKSPLGYLPMSYAMVGKGSSDPKLEEEFRNDPMTYSGGLRGSTGIALLHGTLWLEANLQEVSHAFFVQHGTSDRVCAVEGSQLLYEKARTPLKNKKLVLYDGLEHELLRGVGCDKVIEDWVAWLIEIDENESNQKREEK